MSLALCANNGADRAVSYYNSVVNSNYITGLIANLALTAFTLLKADKGDVENRIMIPVLVELFCISLYLCSTNLSCFKTAILAMAKDPVDTLIVKVDDKIAKLSHMIISDYLFQINFFSMMRTIASFNGWYYAWQDRRAIGAMLSVALLSFCCMAATRQIDEGLLIRLWNECKR